MKNKGFIYIFSNSEYSGLLKIGKTKKNPILRADQLSKHTGAIGSFNLEWHREVSEMDIAEIFIHFTFRKFHFQKEFFKIDIEKAKTVADFALSSLFELDNKIHSEMMKIDTFSDSVRKETSPELIKLALELEIELNKL